jgi:hypothetical protein
MNGKNWLNWVSPLMLGVVLASVWIGYGALHIDKEYNQLYFVVGIPLLVLSVGLHLLIRRITGGNVLTIWLIELLLVAGVIYSVRR